MKQNFEENIKNLENIIAKLESGECSLEESIELFEEGMKSASECKEALNNAEKKIIQLSEIEKEDSACD